MDQKQFETFGTAIQWVKDEAEHPEASTGVRHNQSTWGWGLVQKVLGITQPKNSKQVWAPVCPSACCLAGSIVLVAGDKFITPETAEGNVNVDYCLTSEGNVEGISERAKDLAGLTGGEAQMLFEGSNSAEFLIESATLICARNGYELNLL